MSNRELKHLSGDNIIQEDPFHGEIDAHAADNAQERAS